MKDWIKPEMWKLSAKSTAYLTCSISPGESPQCNPCNLLAYWMYYMYCAVEQAKRALFRWWFGRR